MSRILKVTLITVLFGLVGLGCINPTDPGFLDDVGDEVRLTDNALVECDPVFYETTSYDNDIRNARIAYHDGESIHLYDYASDTEEIIYTAPGGYTITALTAISIDSRSYQGLLIALEGNSEAVIIQEDALEFTEIYRENGERIDNLSGILHWPDSYYFLFEQSDEIYYRDMTNDNTFRKIQNGESPIFMSNGDTCLYVKDDTDLYKYYIAPDMLFPFYVDGSNFYDLSLTFNSIVRLYTYAASDREGDVDIWRFTSDERELVQVTDITGVEKDICAWDEYVVFTRMVDGQTDIYIVRGGYC